MPKQKLLTGIGYLMNSRGQIVAKVDVRPGEHEVKAGYSIIEVATRKELDEVVVYKKPKTKDQRNEEKIQKEMNNLLRDQAIEILTAKGELEV